MLYLLHDGGRFVVPVAGFAAANRWRRASIDAKLVAKDGAASILFYEAIPKGYDDGADFESHSDGGVWSKA